jgi:hypothetical protein
MSLFPDTSLFRLQHLHKQRLEEAELRRLVAAARPGSKQLFRLIRALINWLPGASQELIREELQKCSQPPELSLGRHPGKLSDMTR